MSTERSEFRPIEEAPARRAWPFAVLGAVIVALLLVIARRDTGGEPQKVALSNVAGKIDPKAVTTALAQPSPNEAAKTEAAKAQEGPNVLGNAVSAAKGLATVARAELDRELARTHGAQKQAAAYRKQVEDLQKQLTEARSQIAAVQRAKQPPPPSDQEQILQMLAPVLRSNNDGRP
jgi:chromosome segregation ATPase